MKETTRALKLRVENKDYEKYLKGNGLDIGGEADPLIIFEGKITLWTSHKGELQLLLGEENEVYDFVYSSHILEHRYSVLESLYNWVRVTKVGGFVYIVVPDYMLYEKLQYPSRFNRDHKHTFS